tara:strand:- start:597 stop:731 length:135 start_codon:yes stop_codon:yes gene_type:complete
MQFPKIKILDKISIFQTIITAKTAIYFCLAAYWGIILFGTIFNI